mgnify:CR=1 FL=1
MLLPPLALVLLILGIAYPMLEIAVLIKAGSVLGFWPTLAIVVGTAILGMRVLQAHGFMVIHRLSEAVKSGRTPFLPMIEGGVLFLAGLCLIAPGLITDAIGFVLLIPPVRHFVATLLHDRVWGLPRAAPGNTRQAPPEPDIETPGPNARRSSHSPPAEGPVIEGEFERIDERPIDPRTGRGKPRN